MGSISAENIDQNDFQIVDDNALGENSFNDNSLMGNDFNDNSLMDNDFNEHILEDNELYNDILEDTDLNDDILESTDLNDDELDDNENSADPLLNANMLNDENTIDDSEIAKDIHVNFSHKVFVNDTGNITIELPENANGILRVAIDDVEIYNETIAEKSVNVPIVIPKPTYPILISYRDWDYTFHAVSVFYNDIRLDIDPSLMVMINNPDYGFYLNVPKEVLKGDANSFQSAGLVFPSSANGTVEVYLDDAFFGRFNSTQHVFLNISKINSLSLGSHKIKAIFSGDDYYHPCEKNASFEVVDFLIEIPQDIVLDHNDCIYAKSVKYTDGTLTVLFDGKKIFSKKLDQSHEFLESLFSKVTCGEHMIEVRYNSNKFNYTKKQSVNISYVVDMWGGMFRYGDDNTVYAIVPHDFNASLVHITIGGKSYPIKIDDSGWIELNVSKLTAGNYTMNFDFSGDKKYYNYSATCNFSVYYGFRTPDFVDYLDGSTVSIDLPSSANGNLELYINNKLYKSVKLYKGKTSIRVDQFACGIYDMDLKYTGNDFEVENISTSFYIYPKVITPYMVKCGENKSIVVQVSKDSKGLIIFKVGKTTYKVPIKDGKAALSLKNFKIGEYDFDIDYVGEDGFNCSSFAYVEIEPAKIKIKGAKNLAILYTSNRYYKVKVYNNQSKLAKGVIVKFKVGKITYKVKTDKKGVAKLKLSKLAPKTYKITISYKGTKVTKKLTVKHILKLKSVKVRKNAKKLVLIASLKKVNGKYLKSKVIKFRFRGKTYKAKTNSKGIAKVTVKGSVLKKLKVGKKVSYKAIYLKDTAKRTAKVKK